MGVETAVQFRVACPDGVSDVEMKKAVVASDKFVKWELVLHAKPSASKATTNVYDVSVEATAYSTEDPLTTKFVYGSCKLTYIGGQCTNSCRSYGCQLSYHSNNVEKEGPLSNNFYFKMDGCECTATTGSGRSDSHATIHVTVTMTHFKDVEKHPVLSPVDPCVLKNLKAGDFCLLCILDSGELSDVTFVVGDQEIKAHTVILAVASDVFKAMFQHDTEDKRTGRITVGDVDVDDFRAMLRCVYTDAAPEWLEDEHAEDSLFGLLFLAEKYLLVALRGHCQRRILSTLTVDNVVARLKAVNIVSPYMVPLLADPFVRKHHAEILSSEAWTTLMKDDVALAANVMLRAMKS